MKGKLKDDPPPPPEIEWTEMTRALAQVVLGNLMVVGGAGSISYYCELCYVATGIWVGVLVLATGILGVIDAARENSRASSGLRSSYVIMLITCSVLAMALFGVELAGALIDSQGCDKPIFGNSTVAPPETTPVTGIYSSTPSPIASDCKIECVYIHSGLGAFAILEFAISVACIVLAFQTTSTVAKEADPLPYKPMMPEPIPYAKA